MLRHYPATAFLYGMVIFGVLGCASGRVPAPADLSEEMPVDFLARPRFEKPLPRPLGRVMLVWQQIDEAAGYEIQMSGNQDFTRIEKSWTVRGLNLELPMENDDGRWFRIRAFTAQSRSQWSVPLKVVMSEQ